MAEPASQLPRDVFIDEILDAAKRDKRIFFLSADLGAKALDGFRSGVPDQFLHVGISEQNMMDVAAGLAQNGRIVYTYAMAPFVTMRCFEQIKVALASMNLPVAIIGNGVGYSYNDAGPTHYATEDISCMRGLGADIEILTPSDTQTAVETAKLTHQKPGFRYIRLDRAFLPDVYAKDDTRFLRDGLVEIDPGGPACILTHGFMTQKVREVRAALEKHGHKVAVIDVFRVKPISHAVLAAVLKPYSKVITVEEHFLSGGLGGAIVEAMADAGIMKPVLRLAIPDKYFCDNGGRGYILKLAGLDNETLISRIRAFLEK